MFTLHGKHNKAVIYTDSAEQEAMEQIVKICNEKSMENSKIVIMPDVHAGKGSVIGTTMTIKENVCSNLVGVDIGCGMIVAKIKQKDIDLPKLDNVIRNHVPSGFDVRKNKHELASHIDLSKLFCKEINTERALHGLGTIGGGNHFAEIDIDNDGNLYVVVHTGSRYVGKQVAEFYQDIAYKKMMDSTDEVNEVVKKLKAEKRYNEINTEIQKIKDSKLDINKDLACLYGDDFEHYINDMGIIQMYSNLNRRAILDEILTNMNLTVDEIFTTIHNYIDLEHMILRKGAVSAKKGEKLLIPMNMRDGCIIAVGKGNPDWNFSAPHGAGRILSRNKAKSMLSMEEYEKSMSGIYTTSVNSETLDEAPMAYKPMEEITKHIGDTVDILKIIKPIYNFKN